MQDPTQDVEWRHGSNSKLTEFDTLIIDTQQLSQLFA